MKKAILLLSLLLVSCSASQQGVVSSVMLTGDCPKDGTCSIKLLQNKGVSIKKDDFGRDYLELAESAATNVIQYQYSRTVKGKVQDAGYREEVIFEIGQNVDAMALSDKSLQQIKMLYGRFCFCKGQTGYYPIENGNLKIDGPKSAKSGVLEFEIKEVPQVIHSISFMLK